MTAASVTLVKAMWRGFLGQCPHCGGGRLFDRYLKAVDRCESCSEEMSHHRADDLPAYLVIVIVGHAIVPLVLAVEIAFTPSYWVHGLIWLPLTLLTSVGLLQPTKGAVIGLQWQLGLDGFGVSRKARTEARTKAIPAATSGPA